MDMTTLMISIIILLLVDTSSTGKSTLTPTLVHADNDHQHKDDCEEDRRQQAGAGEWRRRISFTPHSSQILVPSLILAYYNCMFMSSSLDQY